MGFRWLTQGAESDMPESDRIEKVVDKFRQSDILKVPIISDLRFWSRGLLPSTGAVFEGVPPYLSFTTLQIDKEFV